MRGLLTCWSAMLLTGAAEGILAQGVFPIGKDGNPVSLTSGTNNSGAIMNSIHAAVGSLFPTLGHAPDGGGGVPVGAGRADTPPSAANRMDIPPASVSAHLTACPAILELFVQLQVLAFQEMKNSFASPISIHSALDLVYKGAEGASKEQLGAALSYTGNSTEVVAQITKFQEDWNQRYVCYKPVEECGDSYLKMDSAIFLDDDLKVQPAFATSMVANRGGQMSSLMHMVNFKTAATAANQINGWVSNATSGKIKDIVSPESIQPGERMMALNVVYFKGSWQDKFDKSKTKLEAFHSPKGDIMVEMMNKVGKFTLHYNTALKYSVLILPYKGGKFSMGIIKPEETANSTLILAQLRQKRPLVFCNWEENHITQDEQNIELKLPKFSIERTLDLKEKLMQVGVTDIFNLDKANFAAITDARLAVENVIHIAKIKVDEEGSEASAATKVTMVEDRMSNSGPQKFYLDRPFIMMILSTETMVPLFYGHVTNPVDSKATDQPVNSSDASALSPAPLPVSHLPPSLSLALPPPLGPPVSSSDQTEEKIKRLIPLIDSVSWCSNQHADVKRAQAESSICSNKYDQRNTELCRNLTVICERWQNKDAQAKTECEEYVGRCRLFEKNRLECGAAVTPLILSYTRACGHNLSEEEPKPSAMPISPELAAADKMIFAPSSEANLSSNVVFTPDAVAKIIPKIDTVLWCSKYQNDIRKLEAELSVCTDLKERNSSQLCSDFYLLCQSQQPSSACGQYVTRCKLVDTHAKICADNVSTLYDSYTSACKSDSWGHTEWELFQEKLKQLFKDIERNQKGLNAPN